MPLSPEAFSSRRINRIFRPNGRALIVAMDHGNFCGVMPGLSDPGQVIREVVAGGADAILTTFGVAKNYAASFGRAGLLVRLDSGKTILAEEGREWPLRYSVEDAVRLGADGVGCMGFPGSSFEQQTLVNLAQVASDCRRWGMVLLAEMLPGGFEKFDLHTPENIALAARFGAELGADLIKTKFSGSVESFSDVVAGCYRPIVVLGGTKAESEREVLEFVKKAIDAGGAGVAMGRNVWQHERPRQFARALSAIIHEDATVDEAELMLEAA